MAIAFASAAENVTSMTTNGGLDILNNGDLPSDSILENATLPCVTKHDISPAMSFHTSKDYGPGQAALATANSLRHRLPSATIPAPATLLSGNEQNSYLIGTASFMVGVGTTLGGTYIAFWVV